ncbi:MAG TPA: ligase-associated DNA damage response endonuclease PdeM [Burkholderiaceae bacterium]
MKIEAGGDTIELLPQRAVYWPAQRLLLIADIHFGKAASFRALGMPVPHGTTTDNLLRLDGLLAQREIAHILFLGDFLHAKAAHADATLAALRQWRARWHRLQLTLVRGNHDSRAGDPPPDLEVAIVDEPWRIGPYAFCHHPQYVDGAFVFSGHIHPVFHLRARGDAVRLPCFLFDHGRAILPAFGAFTGGHAVQPEAGERVFLAADDSVWSLPPR